MVSIHAAQAGCDYFLYSRCKTNNKFQFTQLKRAATGKSKCMCTATLVSIHAAQAGCDLLGCLIGCVASYCFNSRSPSGLRPEFWSVRESAWTFQFTQPKWAATLRRSAHNFYLYCFNSRSPSGLRPACCANTRVDELVSIHAAQAGCDTLT